MDSIEPASDGNSYDEIGWYYDSVKKVQLRVYQNGTEQVVDTTYYATNYRDFRDYVYVAPPPPPPPPTGGTGSGDGGGGTGGSGETGGQTDPDPGPITGDPDPGSDDDDTGSGDGDTGSGDGDTGGTEPPHEPDISLEYGSWEEIGKTPTDTEEINGEFRTVTTSTVISLRREVERYVDGEFDKAWYQHDTKTKTFTRNYEWIAGGWVLSGHGGDNSALTTEARQEYQAELDMRKIAQATGAPPKSTTVRTTVETQGGGFVTQDTYKGSATSSPSRLTALSDPFDRLDQIKDFFREYGHGPACPESSEYGCGRAVVDFTTWELESGRLDYEN